MTRALALAVPPVSFSPPRRVHRSRPSRDRRLYSARMRHESARALRSERVRQSHDACEHEKRVCLVRAPEAHRHVVQKRRDA